MQNCTFSPEPRTRTRCRSTESKGKTVAENLAIQGGLPNPSSRTGPGGEITTRPSATCSKRNCPELRTDTKETPARSLDYGASCGTPDQSGRQGQNHSSETKETRSPKQLQTNDQNSKKMSAGLLATRGCYYRLNTWCGILVPNSWNEISREDT